MDLNIIKLNETYHNNGYERVSFLKKTKILLRSINHLETVTNIFNFISFLFQNQKFNNIKIREKVYKDVHMKNCCKVLEKEKKKLYFIVITIVLHLKGSIFHFCIHFFKIA